MFGIPLSRVLTASVIASIVGISGILSSPQKDIPLANILIESQQKTYSVGDTFTVGIKVVASEPVNVFKGMLIFDADILQVSAIDYNTSLANLWAEEPWYSNGDGTLGFVGGTTMLNGFMGDDKLLTVTFSAKSVGSATLAIHEIRIFKHDGLGNDAKVGESIDSVISIIERQPDTHITDSHSFEGPTLQVLHQGTSIDLNQDGEQTIADVSIFMQHLATRNLKSDFNQDGTVNLKDLSILME